jgi:hypothetical protein
MGNLSKIHFQDQDFIRKNSLQCNLFLQVDETICRVLIVDQENNIRLIEEQETELFLNKDWSFVNLKFANTFITTLPETFIFIPEEFEITDTGQGTSIAPFLNSDSRVLNAEIKNTTINTYFTINEKVLDFENIFSENKVIPSSNILIQQMLSIASKDVELMGINVYKENIELVYIKNEQFIFYNRFPKANADDFNYYLLSVFEQFGIQVAHTQFYLAGDIDPHDENYERLSKYSSHIHFLADLNREKTSTTLDGRFSNQFLLLSEFSKCV